jgi:hypothetical protein
MLLGCTQGEVAAARIHGSATPVQAPADVYDDPAAPGGKVGRLTADTSTAAGIRNALGEMFALDNGISAHAMVLLHPTEQALAALRGNCQPGIGRACLVIRNTTSSVLSVRVSPFTSLVVKTPVVFNDLVTLTQVQPPGSTQHLLPLMLEGQAIEITPTDGSLGQLVHLTPVLGANQFPPFGSAPIWRNVQVTLELHPNTVVIDGETQCGDSNQCQTEPGLFIQATMRFPEGFVRRHRLLCNDHAASTLPPDVTAETCTQMNAGIADELGWFGSLVGNSCNELVLSSKVSTVELWLGFVPFTRPGCDALAALGPGKALTADPLVGWMRNFPGGTDWRQPCFDYRVVVQASPYVRPAASWAAVESATAGTAVRARAMQCEGMLGALCGAYDCEAQATDRASRDLDTRMTPGIRNAFSAFIDPTTPGPTRPRYLHYTSYTQNGAPGPFVAGPVPPPGCSLASDPACQNRAQLDYVPASLTNIVYSWFAGAFGPVDSVAWHQYPIWRVRPSCTPPAKPGRDIPFWDFDPDGCFRCPTGTTWNKYYPDRTCLAGRSMWSMSHLVLPRWGA